MVPLEEQPRRLAVHLIKTGPLGNISLKMVPLAVLCRTPWGGRNRKAIRDGLVEDNRCWQWRGPVECVSLDRVVCEEL
jgi:hypothetical protein